MIRNNSPLMNFADLINSFLFQTCPHILEGESLSGNTFCLMAGGMLRATGDFLSKEIDEVVKRMYVSDSEGEDDNEAAIRSVGKTIKKVMYRGT